MKESIIQKIPAKTLESGNVSEKDLTCKEAKEWCKQQGDGWRMPTRIELLQAYEDNVDGLSSTESDANDAWNVRFLNGTAYSSSYEPYIFYVRWVKDELVKTFAIQMAENHMGFHMFD